MKRTLANELEGSVEKQIKVQGWLNNLRLMGKLAFLLLRDRTGLIQVVIEDSQELKKVKDLQPGSILKITGKVAPSHSQYEFEIVDPQIEVPNPIFEVPPIEYYKPEMQADLEFILDHRPISLRSRKLSAIFKIQAEIVHAFQLFMHDEVKAVQYFPPNIISASSEGGAEFFNVDYFGYTATLAQSSQLYKQIMVGVNERVYGIVPFFRAEPSQTTRHVAEGKQFEFEFAFFDSWHEIMDIQEECIKCIVCHLKKNCMDELKILGNPLIHAPKDVAIPRITFIEAQKIYFERTGVDERDEPDLSPAAERELCKWSFEKYGTDLVFITDWKTEKRPFYSYPNPKDPTLTNTFDLLCAGIEITSGGQRRHTYESMVEGILAKKMDPEHFTDYLSIFQYGMPPHGGFGMGLERLTMTLLRLKNIREASLFPSDTKRIASNRIKAKICFGGENIRNEIIHQLKAKKIDFNHQIHAPTPTSQDSADVRSTHIEEGIKALILRGKSTKKNYQFNIPGHLKVDMKAVAQIVGEKCEFEDPLVIEERFGLKIGGIPPFGNLLSLDTYYDEAVLAQEKCAFNCGLVTESIIMNPKDLISVVDPKMGKFSK